MRSDDLISTLANLSPQLFRGHRSVRNSLIDCRDPPSPPLRQKSAIPHPSGNCSPVVVVVVVRLGGEGEKRRPKRRRNPPKPQQQIHSVIIIGNF